MNVLENLPEDHKNLLIRLPYRIGLYVSESDDTGGSEAEEMERRTLQSLIGGFTTEVFGSELVQYIMHGTFSHQQDWDGWGAGLDKVPKECHQAVGVLTGQADPKEISAFTHHMVELAEAVALAHRETPVAESPLAKVPQYAQYFLSRLRGKKADNRSFEEFLNISDKERSALKEVARALGESYM